MDPVNQLSQIMQTLRQRMSAQTQKTDRAHGQQTDRGSRTRKQSAGGKASLEQVRNRIRERVRQLAPDQRDGKQAAQIFVESILVWEFGEELLQDPRFEDLSREVQEIMTGDPETWKRFKGLLSSL